MQPDMDSPRTPDDDARERSAADAAHTARAADDTAAASAAQPAAEAPPAASSAAAGQASQVTGPCLECLRRSWVIAQIGHHLDHHRFDARKLAGLLEHDDLELVHEVAPSDEPELRTRYAAFDPAWLPPADGVERLCLHDLRYPPLLRTTKAPPAVLYVAGRIDVFEQLAALPAVAIVGSRRATSAGAATARRLAAELAGEGFLIVSGAAVGIDSAAHTAALDVGGRTISVLPCGIDVPYPARMKELREQLLKHACLVSELPPRVLPRSWSFPARNRIIAGLAQALVVVEAAKRSGSLSAARVAQLVGRPVGAVPGPIEGENSAGTVRLLQDGAYPVADASDVKRMLTRDAAPVAAGSTPPLVGAEQPAQPSAGALPPGAEELEEDLRTVLEAVANGHETVAALTAKGINGSTALTGLATLELRGFVERRGDGSYRIRR